jgi:hypothetical protein
MFVVDELSLGVGQQPSSACRTQDDGRPALQRGGEQGDKGRRKTEGMSNPFESLDEERGVLDERRAVVSEWGEDGRPWLEGSSAFVASRSGRERAFCPSKKISPHSKGTARCCERTFPEWRPIRSPLGEILSLFADARSVFGGSSPT